MNCTDHETLSLDSVFSLGVVWQTTTEEKTEWRGDGMGCSIEQPCDSNSVKLLDNEYIKLTKSSFSFIE